MTRRTLVRGLLVVAVLVVVAVVVGVAILPHTVRRLATWSLESTLRRPVRIDTVELSLRTGRFVIHGLRVADRDGGELARFARLEGRVRRGALLRLHVWIEELTLTDPFVRIVRTGPNQFNISDLLGARREPRRVLDITVDRFTLTGGSAVLEDRTLKPARTWRSEQVRLDARHLSTRGADGTAVGSTTLAGALVTVRVEELRLVPVHLRAHVNVRDLDLALAALYLPPDAPVRLERGGVNAAVQLVHDHREGLRLDGDAVVERIVLHRRGQAGAFVTSPSVTVAVRDLTVDDGGGLAVGRVALDGEASVVDAVTATPPRTWRAEALRMEARNLSAAGAGGTATASTTVAGALISGRVERLSLQPLELRAHVNVRDLDLTLANLYLPADSAVRPERGAVNAAFRIAHDARQGTRVDADAIVERVVLRRPDQDPPFATSPALTVTLRELAVDSRGAMTVGRIAVDGPATIVDGGVNPPGRLELAALQGSAEALSRPARAPARVAASARLVGGGTLDVSGTVSFEPRALDLRARLTAVPLATAGPWLPIRGRIAGLADLDAAVTARLEPTLALSAQGTAGVARLTLSDDRRPVLTVERFAAQDFEYTWPARAKVKRLELRRPVALVERDATGGWPLAELVTPRVRKPGPDGTAGAATGAPVPVAPSVEIVEAVVEDGAASWRDAGVVPAASIDVTAVAFALENATWPVRGPLIIRHLRAVLPGGGEVSVAGRGQLDRQRARLSVVFENIDLAMAQPYLPFVARVAGRVQGDVTLAGALDPLRFTVRGAVGAGDLAFRRDDRPLLTVGRVDASGVEYRWPARISIASLRVQKPWAAIEREPNGDLSLRALFAPRQTAAAARGTPSGPTAPGPPLEVGVADALFEDGATNIVDTSVEPAARFRVQGTRLAVQDFTWPTRGPARVHVTTPMPRGGTLEGRGTLEVTPPRMTMAVSLRGVELAPAQPYLPIAGRIAGNVDGELTVAGVFEPLRVMVEGTAAINRFTFGDGSRSLLTFDRVEVSRIAVDWPPRVSIGRVDIRRPTVLIERDEGGRLPLQALLTPRGRETGPPTVTPAALPAATPRTGVPAPARPAAVVDIGVVSLQGGAGRFVDRFTEPDFADDLSSVNVTLEGLSTRPGSRARLASRALFGVDTEVTVNAELGPLGGPRFLDLRAEVKALPLSRANPYLDHFLGWTAQRGVLNLSGQYRVEGDELQATHQVHVNDPAITRSRDDQEMRQRVGLPLDLLVSLLKDSHGDVRLAIPVQGNVAAREFDFSEAVWGAVRNLAIRLVALPFSGVGRLFFTEDSRIQRVEIDPVPFPPGAPALTEAGEQQLKRLAELLRQAPDLRLVLRAILSLDDVARLKREAALASLAKRAKNAGPDALREQAARRFARRYPRREVPTSLEALLDQLERDAPAPEAALRALAASRLQTVRQRLAAAGVDGARLEVRSDAAVVESVGQGRVEFDIAHAAARPRATIDAHGRLAHHPVGSR